MHLTQLLMYSNVNRLSIHEPRIMAEFQRTECSNPLYPSPSAAGTPCRALATAAVMTCIAESKTPLTAELQANIEHNIHHCTLEIVRVRANLGGASQLSAPA